MDSTEGIRRIEQAAINAAAGERAAMEARHGRVWDTAELRADYEVRGFMAPYVVVRRLSDGAVGSLQFQHHPRYYWGWEQDR